ncbi:uncharacterized protein YrrD [Spinactinospora alkalitolerans]|uniref:Uncharacterized protein YrrD n=1 Tax=Spinactinospora alkalitolerans TaxID=687207 RepID=A0A852U154_9ACTN|nr:PRC-barrel domain-containing protein [Spinactinospora alkalitolerans]NYE47730.1 uncharacterized protein YrrD [Spinactinospora alkalitolerans]
MPTIRVSDLLGRPVFDNHGDNLGKVQDVVVRHTPEGRYEVLGLIAGHSAVAGRFGYGGSLEPPTPLRPILHWLRRHERYLRWEGIEDLGDDAIRVSVESAELTREWREDTRG